MIRWKVNEFYPHRFIEVGALKDMRTGEQEMVTVEEVAGRVNE
ncbi:Uncharacterised protein [uncultured archaeon]|nr:Uncharacterised protein [uncultured archaeon]